MSELAGSKGPRSRPQFRNIHVSQILQYRLPAAGIVSILHRVSGALMFLLGLPFALYLFQQSITSEISFDSYRAIVGSVPGITLGAMAARKVPERFLRALLATTLTGVAAKLVF